MKSRRRRPATVTWLSIGVLTVAALNGVRAGWLWQRRLLLASFPFAAPLQYLIVTALLWSVVWFVTAVGLWRLARWGRWLALGSVLLYHAHNWIHRWLFEISEYSRQVWPWQTLVTFLSVAITWFILWRPGVRRSFEE